MGKYRETMNEVIESKVKMTGNLLMSVSKGDKGKSAGEIFRELDIPVGEVERVKQLWAED